MFLRIAHEFGFDVEFEFEFEFEFDCSWCPFTVAAAAAAKDAYGIMVRLLKNVSIGFFVLGKCEFEIRDSIGDSIGGLALAKISGGKIFGRENC